MSSTNCQSQKGDALLEHSKSIYCEIFEDADAIPDNKCNARNLNELNDQPDTTRKAGNEASSNGVLSQGAPSQGAPSQGAPSQGSQSNGALSNNLDTTEDWDKEIQDSLAYNLVLETFKERSHNKVYFQNQLQNLLYSYPPASQAFTKTANYESAIYSSPVPPPCSNRLSCPADAGQFDDADEDGCMES